MAAMKSSRAYANVKVALAAKTVQLQPKPSLPVMREITHEMIAQRAREIWGRKGKPAGQCVQNWLEAEAELRAALEGACQR